MPYKHIISRSDLAEIIEQAQADDNKDAKGIREMYWLPSEAVGEVVKWHMHWGHTFCEITDVNMDEETVSLSELFTDREFTTTTDNGLDKPFIGAEFNIQWIEGKTNDEWERISDYATPDSPVPASTDKAEEYDNTRIVEKSYTYGSEKYSSWAIRIDRQTGNPTTVLDPDTISNADVYNDIMENIDLPENFALKGLQIGTIYTDEEYVETEDGVEKEYNIVWWEIDSQFQKSAKLSPVSRLPSGTEIDHSVEDLFLPAE